MERPETAQRIAAAGDVVVCDDPAWRENLKVPSELGLVLEARKDRAKVFFPEVGGEPWLPLEALSRVKRPVQSPRVPAWMQRAHFLVQSLDTLFVEVTHVGDDGCALRIFHGEIELADLDALRASLGDELRYWRLLPAGLHKIESAIAYLARARDDAPEPAARPTPEGTEEA